MLVLVGAIRRVKPFVPASTLHTLYKAHVQPYFDYFSPMWEKGKGLKEKFKDSNAVLHESSLALAMK